jgi:hypothetical protein
MPGARHTFVPELMIRNSAKPKHVVLNSDQWRCHPAATRFDLSRFEALIGVPCRPRRGSTLLGGQQLISRADAVSGA